MARRIKSHKKSKGKPSIPKLSNPDLRPVFAWDFFSGWNAGK